MEQSRFGSQQQRFYPVPEMPQDAYAGPAAGSVMQPQPGVGMGMGMGASAVAGGGGANDLSFFTPSAPLGMSGTMNLGGSVGVGGGAGGGMSMMGGMHAQHGSHVDASGQLGGLIGSGGRSGGSGSFDPDDEPPLLEELGIDLQMIVRKAVAVALPLSNLPADLAANDDLAGPLFFCLMLGAVLLLHGKVLFGYLLGFGVIGCYSLYWLVSLMSDSHDSLSWERIFSVLGYSILPEVGLAIYGIVFNLRGTLGFLLSALVVAWCTYSAVRLIESLLSFAREQRWLIAYPVALFFGAFTLLTAL